jgi:hypothetical protein
MSAISHRGGSFRRVRSMSAMTAGGSGYATFAILTMFTHCGGANYFVAKQGAEPNRSVQSVATPTTATANANAMATRAPTRWRRCASFGMLAARRTTTERPKSYKWLTSTTCHTEKRQSIGRKEQMSEYPRASQMHPLWIDEVQSPGDRLAVPSMSNEHACREHLQKP